MQNEKNLKLLFDSVILKNWTDKDAARSGIYFTAVNILKELSKSDKINVTLYCNYKDYKKVLNFSRYYLPKNSVDILIKNDTYCKCIQKMYKYLLLKSCQAKAKKKYYLKSLLNITKFIVGIFYKLTVAYYNLKLKNKLKFYDCYFSPMFRVPKEICSIKTIKKYTLLHDVIPLLLPSLHQDSNKNSWFWKMINSINSNDYYIANSDNTKRDFIKYCPKIDPEKITTALLACDERFKPQDMETIVRAKQKYYIPVDKKYVFSLCTLEPRKNLIRAVKTFIQFIKKNNIDDLYFVLGGGYWDSFIEKLEKEIENLGDYKDKIIKAGYIDDADLPSLYSGAEWFVYTSQYEGFGLPPLEAMSCMCPVIVSNNSSLPEVVGDSGILIDFDSDEQHIESYEKYYFNKELRDSFAHKGLEHSQNFSWEKCVNTMIEFMKG